MDKTTLKAKFQAIKADIDKGITEAKDLQKDILSFGDKVSRLKKEIKVYLKEKAVEK